MPEKYDLIIIGGGPAGLSAGLYAARGNLSTLILERGLPGGELNNTLEIENYPGIDHKTGPELAEMMLNHCTRFGAQIKQLVNIKEINLKPEEKLIKTDVGDFSATAIIIATGSRHKKLGVSGEEALSGRGVSYCATCDGAFFKEKHVVVIGGGNSAIEEGIFLTRFASKVTVIHRRDTLRAEKILQERAFKNPKMQFIWNSSVESINSEEGAVIKKVSSVRVKNLRTSEVSELACDGVFVYVGLEPNVELFDGQIEIDEEKRIIATERLETNIPGVFVAGDVRVTPLKQAVCAAADGALAAVSAIAYLEK